VDRRDASRRARAGRSRRSTPGPGEPAAWGRAAACQFREETVMPEDAPGNPGAARPAGPPARQVAVYRAVREMQAKLHRWAGEDHSRRFGDLLNLVSDPDFLAEAWLRVKANAGSRTPGIDGATVADIENRIGVGAFLEEIRGLLKSGGFRPVPVRQVMIPKKSGKLRKLGIPTEPANCPVAQGS
jgi:RNA-directed DNA polymerase